MLVDPEVTKTKFDQEIADYRKLEDDHLKRGWWMLKADFPEIFVVFASPKVKPPAVLFGALLDFTNYDFWPPSVRLVDPFTRIPYGAHELPTPLPRLIAPIIPGKPPETQTLMQVDGDGIPFLCIAGTREYHQHPAHTGDSWLLHRKSGKGTLHYLLNQIYQYGVVQFSGYTYKLNVTIESLQYQLTTE